MQYSDIFKHTIVLFHFQLRQIINVHTSIITLYGINAPLSMQYNFHFYNQCVHVCIIQLTHTSNNEMHYFAVIVHKIVQ